MTYIGLSMTDFLFLKIEAQFQLIIEGVDELCSWDKDVKSFSSKTKREREKLASQNLIKQLYPKVCLSHNSYGAPILSNKKAISLSHSKDFLACITAENIAAIDIEPISEKAFRLKNKFLSAEEIALAKNEDIATLMWCAKECLYKIHQKGKVNFSEDIILYSIENNTIKCSIFEQDYQLKYEKFKEHWLVYYFD